MFDTKQMTEMAEKMAALYKTTGMEPQKFFEGFQKMIPETPTVKFNKNGYEIRAQLLEMAQNQMWQDYNAKWGQFSTSVSKNGKEVVAKVELPEIPGTEQVLEAAKKYYDFVNNSGK